MSVQSYIEELRDLSKDVTAAGLAQISGLYGEDAEKLFRVWSSFPSTRRQEIVARLLELAEENVEMDFQFIFHHAMEDEDAAVRRRAVAGLWESSDRRSVPGLIDRLENDADAEVRAAAATVLGHFAQLAEEGKLIPRDRDRIYSALMSALANEAEPMEVRRRALEAVAPFQDDAVQRWVRWAHASEDPLLRQSSVFAMGRTQAACWIETVCEELSSADPAMRYEAANAARELAAEEAVPRLAELSQDEDRQVAMASLQALAGIGGGRAKRMLRGLAAMSEDEALREAAEQSLRELQSEESDFTLLDAGQIDRNS